MIETPEIDSDIQEIKGLLHDLIREVQSLRRERLPANGKEIEFLN